MNRNEAEAIRKTIRAVGLLRQIVGHHCGMTLAEHAAFAEALDEAAEALERCEIAEEVSA